MQNSGVSGWNIEAVSPVRRMGSLLIKNERSKKVVCDFSLRNIALERTSNDARMRSIVVVCISPYLSSVQASNRGDLVGIT